MKNIFSFFVLIFLFQSCSIPKFYRDNYYPDELTTEIDWGSGGGKAGNGPSHSILFEKKFSPDGKLISKSKERLRFRGCVGKTIYEKTKRYDLKGKVIEIIVVTKTDTTTISFNQSGQRNVIKKPRRKSG
jgi:hypothetical protein